MSHLLHIDELAQSPEGTYGAMASMIETPDMIAPPETYTINLGDGSTVDVALAHTALDGGVPTYWDYKAATPSRFNLRVFND